MNENEVNNIPNNTNETSAPPLTPDNNIATPPIQETNPQNSSLEQTPPQEIPNAVNESNIIEQSNEIKTESSTTINNTPKKASNTSIIIIAIIISVLILGGLGSFIAFKVIVPWYQTRQAAKKIMEQATGTNGNAEDIINQASDIISNGVNSMKTDEFNDELENYVGTKDGDEVKELFDKIIMTIKKNKEHTITVTYNTTNTSDTTELTNLKQQFDDSKQYEVSMDYDDNGYINAITIKEL